MPTPSKPTDSTIRLPTLQATLREAAVSSGRDPDTVHLLAVSKQQPEAKIRQLVRAGQHDFGENYLQEALPKIEALKDLNLTWHFVGQIQSNKTRAVAEHFAWAHTVDRDKIATRLNEQRSHYGAPLNVCIQVKLVEETGKGGVAPAEVPKLATHITRCQRLKLRGLMCIPPPSDDLATQLGFFKQVQTLFMELKSRGFAMDTLSMGMSGDYRAAIAAGATLVRIGTALFGSRVPTHE